ncbi:MAG: DUF1844 domain-containing protein [Proteobacteria bacterium]|nr:DUF1844 domain-containing protein [Pseudomonadota bacterium]
MADKKEEAFKVTDKRSSSGTQDVATEKTAEGDGFTMKSTKEEAPNEIDFSTLVYSFATGALISMGVAPDPNTKKVQKNIVMAKQNIEILVMLQNKTKGNLSVEEAKFLENILMEVRLRFVETSR